MDVPRQDDRTAGSGHLRADQSAVLRFMADPASYTPLGAERPGSPPTEVQRIDTHGAIVFLAGTRAYKVKRAVSYPYMDFSTLERRRWACEREFTLNARTAPSLYQKVIAVTADKTGALALDGDGEPVEWVLVMQRFQQGQLLSNLAEAGRLTPAMASDLAEAIAEFHAAAPPAGDGQSSEGQRGDLPRGAKAMEWVIVENNEEFAERNDLFPPAMAAQLAEHSLVLLARHRALLDDRANSGHQRLCHGDLHLRNVVLLDGRPTLFDAIEFNDFIACVDVLYDLAFLLMDLQYRDLRPLANLVLNRYLQAREELAGLALLPLFLSVRAAVRAKVAASLEAVAEHPEEKTARAREALSYFEQALRFLDPPPPMLVAVGGLSGSGKTSLARLLAPDLGPPPGAVHLRSDVLRKTLAGVDEKVRLPPEAYSQAASEAVYNRMLGDTGLVLRAGHAVIVDGVFARPEERAAVAAVARAAGLAFHGLWLQASPDALMARVEARQGDASDATAAVVKQQLSYNLGAMDWARVDTTADLQTVAQRARLALGLSD